MKQFQLFRCDVYYPSVASLLKRHELGIIVREGAYDWMEILGKKTGETSHLNHQSYEDLVSYWREHDVDDRDVCLYILWVYFRWEEEGDKWDYPYPTTEIIMKMREQLDIKKIIQAKHEAYEGLPLENIFKSEFLLNLLG